MKRFFSILLAFSLVCSSFSTFVVEASEVSESSESKGKTNIGTATTQINFIKVKGSQKADKIVISAPKLKEGQNVFIALCDSNKQRMSEGEKIKKADGKVTYFLRKDSTYYLEIKSNNKSVNLYMEKETKQVQAGSSFSKAAAISSGSTKSDVLGFNNSIGTKHYFKINVPNEKLVKVSFKKSESSSKKDTLHILIYKSSDKNTPVAEGYIFEGQKSAYMYIRNSNTYKTLPGTYYIVVNKSNKPSGFQYSITY